MLAVATVREGRMASERLRAYRTGGPSGRGRRMWCTSSKALLLVCSQSQSRSAPRLGPVWIHQSVHSALV